MQYLFQSHFYCTTILLLILLLLFLITIILLLIIIRVVTVFSRSLEVGIRRGVIVKPTWPGLPALAVAVVVAVVQMVVAAVAAVAAAEEQTPMELNYSPLNRKRNKISSSLSWGLTGSTWVSFLTLFPIFRLFMIFV